MDNTEYAIAVLQCMVLQRDLHLSPIQHAAISFTMEALKEEEDDDCVATCAEVAELKALKPLPTLEELERVIDPLIQELFETKGSILTLDFVETIKVFKRGIATAILDLLKGEIKWDINTIGK